MDIFRLNPNTYMPDDLLEGYNSMIWTERFSGFGEFEFKTSQVFPTLENLPEGALISLLDSNEVMLVETRSIDVDADGNQELTITGRSFETFLENRVQTADSYQVPWLTIQPYRYPEMAELLYWTGLVTTSGQDVTRPNKTLDGKSPIPNTVVTESISGTYTSAQRWLESGFVYPVAQDFLALGDLGVRTIRPNRTTGAVVTFNTSNTAARGTISKTMTPNITQLRFDIYNGVDRTRYQSTYPPILFHYDSGHVDDPKYLFSTKEYRSMATIVSSIGTIDVYPEAVTSRNAAATGIDRRVLYMDGGDMGDQDYQTFYQSLIQKAQAELKKHNRIRLFDGAISPVSPYVYGRDYFLGDQVSLLARFGFEEVMLVSEYVRTEDADGDRGYPGLSALPD
jgi:Siphovirus ReqiPepy6 Gp37-like protein